VNDYLEKQKSDHLVNASQLTADWRFLLGYLLGFGLMHLGYARSRFIGNM